MFGSNASGFGPWFSVFRDAEGEGGNGASDDDDKDGKSDGDGKKPDTEFDVDAWLKEQPEDARKALSAKYETDVAGLKSALTKERDARAEADKVKAELEKKRAEAEDESLAENKKYEELAEKRKTQLDELKSQAEGLDGEHKVLEERAKAAEDVVAKHVEAVKAAMKLDDPTLELLELMPAVDQLAWLTKHQETLVASGAKGGLIGSPRETGDGKMTEEDRQSMTVDAWRS